MGHSNPILNFERFQHLVRSISIAKGMLIICEEKRDFISR